MAFRRHVRRILAVEAAAERRPPRRRSERIEDERSKADAGAKSMPPLLKLLFDDDRVVVVLTADADFQVARRNRTFVQIIEEYRYDDQQALVRII